jgi:hypothetical protein
VYVVGLTLNEDTSGSTTGPGSLSFPKDYAIRGSKHELVYQGYRYQINLDGGGIKRAASFLVIEKLVKE